MTMRDVGIISKDDFFKDIAHQAQRNIDGFGWLNVSDPDALMQVVQESMELGRIVRDLARALVE